MVKQTKISTRDKILKASARMFSERGYDRVTTREIAKDIGINSASIYYHFPSKVDILHSLYNLYSQTRRQSYPDLGELLRIAETHPPHAVLMMSIFHYSEENVEMLDQILVTAARRLGTDPESESFISENFIESITITLKPLCKRLIELGKVKPFDIDEFLKVLNFYCFSAAALNNSLFALNFTEYQAGMSLLFSIIAPVES